jgi:nucleoid-associated protein YgaU
MGTDAHRCCPVCSEPFDAPPAECFRCETPLSSWWPFEEAALDSQRPRAPRILPLAVAALAGPVVAAIALRIMTGTALAPVATVRPAMVAEAPTPPAPTVPAASASALVSAAPAVVSYRVQGGDSLWRIAAALTGDGRNWKTLWPARDPAQPLAVGTVLEVPIR